jgi:sucrose-6-phosphate hydrolase SacC (GH32 family)
MFRPSFHFTPPQRWLNDPNGLVYLQGQYHLFYQHNPLDVVWGPMHWGHAASADLLHWQHLPIALAPDKNGAIFSGSAVVDEHNSAGLGAGALVAAFTHHRRGRQAQSLAYSIDAGITWVKHPANPLLPSPPGVNDFRDPKVFWYAARPGAAGHWVMLLAVHDCVWFYTSPDLQTWKKSGEFGRGWGAQSGVWETPECFPLPVEDQSRPVWVLLAGIQNGAPSGGSGTQYFLGDFDGERFVCQDTPKRVRWADYGADFYALQTWNNAPGGRRVGLAWMNNWLYAQRIPAGAWRGAFTTPRQFSLAGDGENQVLIQQPVDELLGLRRAALAWDAQTLAPGEYRIGTLQGPSLDIEASFELQQHRRQRFGLRLPCGARSSAVLSIEPGERIVNFERPAPAGAPGSFARPQRLTLDPAARTLELRILIDAASIEVFLDGGRCVLTNQVFPGETAGPASLFVEGAGLPLQALRAWELQPAASSGAENLPYPPQSRKSGWRLLARLQGMAAQWAERKAG